MVVKPIVSSSKPDENNLFLPGKSMVIVSLRTLSEIGLDDGPLLVVFFLLTNTVNFIT